MLKPWQHWTLTALAVATAVLIGLNMYRFSENRKLQADFSQRAQFIQQTVPLEALSRDIALALAQLGVRNQDAQIAALLSSLGISVTVNSPASAAAPSTSASAAQGAKK
jgi:ABC-type proline/glycine betaine transport system permease subunit